MEFSMGKTAVSGLVTSLKYYFKEEEMKKIRLLCLVVAMAALCLLPLGCKKKGGKGGGGGSADGAKLIASAKKVADAGCKCKNKSCLFKIRVNGHGVMWYYMRYRTKRISKLGDKQQAAYDKNMKRYIQCERNLKKAARK